MNFFFPLILLALLFTSCAHQKKHSGVSITTASSGLMKNQLATFNIYLTDKLTNRIDLEKKYSNDIFIIHTGHLLKAKLSKLENEKNLHALEEQGYNLINLTLEDFAIAELQGINFEDFEKLNFINSSVIDLTVDDLASGKNISPSVSHEGVVFIGLSDNKLDKGLTQKKYIINDYVLSVLKVKKATLSTTPPESLKSFIIIHTLGSEINNVMLRLPPSFINSLAD